MCDCLQQVIEKTGCELPFCQPMTINRETLKFECGRWAVEMHKRTKSGNVSKLGGKTLFLAYCPVCGEKFEDEEA